MNTKLIIGISVALVATGGILAYRYFVPPELYFPSYTPDNHSGEASFGGVINHFGNGSYTQVGRMGWELEVKGNANGNTIFNLLKNGKFIKQLAVKWALL